MSNLQPSAPVGDVTLFTAVDRTKGPGFFTHFLGEANKLARTGKPLILEALRLGPGQIILDLGCGTGPQEVERWWTDLRAKAEHGEFLAALTAFVVAGTKP